MDPSQNYRRHLFQQHQQQLQQQQLQQQLQLQQQQHHQQQLHAPPFVVATHVSVPVAMAPPPPPSHQHRHLPQALPVLSAAAVVASGATAASAALSSPSTTAASALPSSSSSIYRPQKSDIARLSRLLLETPGPIDLHPFDALLLDTECLMEMAFQMQNRAAAAVAAASLATASAAHAAAASVTATAATVATAATAATTTTPLRTVSNGHATADALAEARRLHVELEYSNGQLRTQLAKTEAEARQGRHYKREAETLRRLHAEASQDMLDLRSHLARIERKPRDREGTREREREGTEGAATVEVAAVPLTRNPSDHTKPSRRTNGSHIATHDDGDHSTEAKGAAARSATHPSSPTRAQLTVPEVADETSERLRRLQGINRKLKVHLHEERASHGSRLTAERCKHERALRAYLRASVHALSTIQSDERGGAVASSRAPSPSQLAATIPATAATIQQSSPPSAADNFEATSPFPPPLQASQLKDPPQPPSREESAAPIPPDPSNGPSLPAKASLATGGASPAQPDPNGVAATGPAAPALEVPPIPASPLQPCQGALKRPASPTSPGAAPMTHPLTTFARNGHAPNLRGVAHNAAR